uniref:Uncharacterized protein n=1 Tax=Arundo donax TaxID=35708 RepID=A0A0A9AL74_ARUDO
MAHVDCFHGEIEAGWIGLTCQQRG